MAELVMENPQVVKIKIDQLRSIRTSLEQKLLQYLHLLWLLDQAFPYDVYVDRIEAPNHILTVVDYGRANRVVQIESFSPSWVSTVLGHVPLADTNRRHLATSAEISLYLRCESILTVGQAQRGEVLCPRCHNCGVAVAMEKKTTICRF